MYKPYASESYYEGKYEGTLIPEDDQKKALIQASWLKNTCGTISVTTVLTAGWYR